MMGTKDRVFASLRSVFVEELVPPDHFYRHLERVLDLDFVRDLVRDAYAETGRPSIDPVIFFKRQLVLIFEGLRSERQLMQALADRLSLRWQLGYDLTEALPDHSSLSRIRERYGLEVFRRFFEAIVDQCLATGLVWGEELYINAIKVAANASPDWLQPRFAVEAHLARLFTAREDHGEESGASGADDGNQPAWLPVTPVDEGQAVLAARETTRHNWIGQAGRPDRAKTSGPLPADG
jgi:transposase